MSEKGTAAPDRELLKQIEDLKAANAAKDLEIERLKSDPRQEKLNAGSVIKVVLEEEQGDVEVHFQFTREKMNIPGLGEISAKKMLANQTRYAAYIERLITKKSELLAEVRRVPVQPDYSQYDDVTIPEMKEVLDKAQVKYDGSERFRAYYLPMYHELQTGGE